MPALRSSHQWYQRHQLISRQVPHNILSWLFDTASLTARLKRHCPNRFSVHVINQTMARPTPEEHKILSIPYGRSALMRQVCLYCNEIPMIYARTVIPLKTLSGAQRIYANLGSKPLGEMLFTDRTMHRDEVMVAEFKLTELPLNEPVEDDTCWGRRSVFRVGSKPLLVSEYFLPGLFGI